MLVAHRRRRTGHLHPAMTMTYSPTSSYRQLAASLRSGLKTRLNGLLALLMRTGVGERRQLQYYHHQIGHHHHYRYNQYQQQQGEEEAGTVV